MSLQHASSFQLLARRLAQVGSILLISRPWWGGCYHYIHSRETPNLYQFLLLFWILNSLWSDFIICLLWLLWWSWTTNNDTEEKVNFFSSFLCPFIGYHFLYKTNFQLIESQVYSHCWMHLIRPSPWARECLHHRRDTRFPERWVPGAWEVK